MLEAKTKARTQAQVFSKKKKKKKRSSKKFLLVQELRSRGFYVQAYADDLAVLVTGVDMLWIRDMAQKAINVQRLACLMISSAFPGHPYWQGWQYGTVRSELAYYVPRFLNRTVLVYRTSVQFLKRTVPTYRTPTITKKAYRTSVPYFLAKIEAYRTVPTYRTAILAFNYS